MTVKAISDLRKHVTNVNNISSTLEMSNERYESMNEPEQNSEGSPSKNFQPNSIGIESAQKKARTNEQKRPKLNY